MALDPSGLPPSGRQFDIGHGSSHVVVTEVGATLRSFTVDGEAVVDGFDEAEMCRDGRGQVLAPWPNRLGDGSYEFGGRQAQAALDEPAKRNAIHGLVRFMPWELRARAQNKLNLECLLQPQPGYPWRLALAMEYRLGRQGLTVTAQATNLDSSPAPFGAGFHPYLMVGTSGIDRARLMLRADHYLRTDDRGLPVGRSPVARSELDYGVAKELGAARLDTCFGGLWRDDQGVARVELHHPDEGRRVELWLDKAFDYVMAYTADTVTPADRRRRSMAIEPMTCPADALRSGTGLVVLAPGARWTGRWGISPG